MSQSYSRIVWFYEYLTRWWLQCDDKRDWRKLDVEYSHLYQMEFIYLNIVWSA